MSADQSITNSSLPISNLSIPFWSVFSHLLTATLVILCQSLFKRSVHFHAINEFLCSLLWVTWTLECGVLTYASSDAFGLTTLFLRLLIIPYIFQGAYVNPCNALYSSLGQGSRRWRVFVGYVGIELAAMVVGVLYCFVLWRILGSTVSEEHSHFLRAEPHYHLHVPTLTGFLMELFLTFMSFVPKLLMQDSFALVLTQAVLTIYLILWFEHMTGAFMNPISALSCTLAWHRLGASDHLVHIVVYWAGPLAGTVLVAGITRFSHKKIE